MSMTHARKTILSGLSLLLTLIVASSVVAQGPPPVTKSVEAIKEEGLATGVADPKRDFKQEALQVIDLNQYVPRTETGQEQEPLILVVEGQRVFCSVPYCPFNANSVDYIKPLADNVQYKWVTMKESVKYYDDGTHGDVLANDGLPSNIENRVGECICPYCYRHMVYLENLRDRAQWVDFWTARQEMRQPLVAERPTTFFAGVQVASLDPEDVSPRNTENPMLNYYVLDQERKDDIKNYESEVIALYKKPLDVGYMDYWLYPDESRRPPPQIPAPQLGAGTSRAGGPRLPPYGPGGMTTPYGPGGVSPYTPYGPGGVSPYTPYGPGGSVPYGPYAPRGLTGQPMRPTR